MSSALGQGVAAVRPGNYGLTCLKAWPALKSSRGCSRPRLRELTATGRVNTTASRENERE